MISYFPKAFPDEIAYSIFSRFHARMNYPEVTRSLRVMFGYFHPGTIVNRPRNLDYFVSQLMGKQYTVDCLIKEHTLLPYYVTFLLPEKVDTILSSMRGFSGKRIRNDNYHMYLQYCPICIVEDQSKYGEPYWHRLHQAVGVRVCPKHKVFLTDSEIEYQRQYFKGEHPLVAAREAVSFRSAIRPIEQRPEHQHLLQIAVDVEFLLNRGELSSELHTFYNRYRMLMVKKGFATKGLKNYKAKLVSSFNKVYSAEFLNYLGVGIGEESKRHWIYTLVANRKSYQENPVKYLIMTHFLGISIEEFLNLPEKHHPFGIGPWPCANQVCDSFGKEIIEYVIIHFRKSDGTPSGTFECIHCGYTYSQYRNNETDFNSSDRKYVKQYGSIFERELSRLWKDPTYTIGTIANMLGVSSIVITRLGKVLKLGKRIYIRPLARPLMNQFWKSDLSSVTDLQEAYRVTMKNILDAHPNQTNTYYRNNFGSIYLWLKDNDPLWFQQYMPSFVYICRPNVDWSKFDSKIAKAIQKHGKRLLCLNRRPARITRNQLFVIIGEEMDIILPKTKNLPRLPQTERALQQVCETVEQVAVRRISWVVKCAGDQGEVLSRSKIMKKANVSKKIENLPLVQKALNELDLIAGK